VPDQETLDLLQKFQTAIVGVIGFTGVILTLIVNAAVARRQVRDNRTHERQVVARALLAELKSHREALARNVGEAKEDESPLVGMITPILQVPVFDANLSRIGVLPVGSIEPVLNAFLCLKEYNPTIALLSHPMADPGHRAVDGKDANKVVTITESMLPPLDDGIAALEKVT